MDDLRTPYIPPIAPGTYRLRGNNGGLLTMSLFLEQWQTQTNENKAVDQKPVFSLSDKEGYISARLSFLDKRDPTGVAWAMEYLEGVNHLNRLLGSDWFREEFEVWVGEVEQILQAEAIGKIRTIASGGSPASFQAAKFLAGKDWKKRRAGRPSKAEVQANVAEAARANRQQDEDLARIIKVVK